MKNIFKLITIALFATLTLNLYAVCNDGEDDGDRVAGDGTVVVPDTATPTTGAGGTTN